MAERAPQAPGRAIPLIMNPTAGGGRLQRRRLEVDAAARSAGAELSWWLTEHPGHAVALARRAADEGRPLVLAFGGDGTYNEVAQGLLGSGSALGVLPGGTTSVLAYELAVPRPASRALVALLAGSDRAMRVGRTDRGELFLLMLSAGPDSMVLERLSPRLKRLGGKVGVAVQAVRELLRREPLPRLRLVVGDTAVECGWVVVGNARCYAGPFRATPGADPFTPSFEVVALRGNRRLRVATFALALPFGRHLRRPDVVRLTADRVRLEVAAGGAEACYQIDGDLGGRLPVELSIDPRPLLLRLPAP